jgi:hypothetical protein
VNFDEIKERWRAGAAQHVSICKLGSHLLEIRKKESERKR